MSAELTESEIERAIAFVVPENLKYLPSHVGFHLAALVAALGEARSRIERARAEHRGVFGVCATCVKPDGGAQVWPCPTIRALGDGENP